MVQQTSTGVPTLPVTTSSSATPSNSQSVPTLSPSSQAYPFPCCCSCCFCTTAVPSGLATAGTAVPPTVSPVHGALLGFPTGPHLNSITSARRRTSSRNSYSYSKRQNNNNNINQNNSMSGSMHSASTTGSQGSTGFPASFPVNALNPLLTKPHKSSSKSANLPTGIHMDNMSNIIIPPLNGHHHTSPVSQQQLMAQSGDTSRKDYTSSELNSGPSVASVVSDLLAKAAAGAKGPQNSFTMTNGSHQGQHLQPVTGGRNQSSSPAASPLSHNSKTFRPSAGSRTPVSPLKSPAVYTDTSGPSITSSSSVVSSSSVSPNSLDSSYASDKYSEASSDRSDFRSNDSACEMMGLIPNGIVFSARQSTSTSSSPITRRISSHVAVHSEDKSAGECERNRSTSHRLRDSPILRKHQPVDVSTPPTSRDASESPRHKNGSGKAVIHERDDVRDTRPESGSKESPASRKNMALRSGNSSSSCDSPTHSTNSIISQTNAAISRAPSITSKSLSSPSSPVILNRSSTSVMSNYSTSSTKSSPAPSENRRNRTKPQNATANDSSSSCDGQPDVVLKKKATKSSAACDDLLSDCLSSPETKNSDASDNRQTNGSCDDIHADFEEKKVSQKHETQMKTTSSQPDAGSHSPSNSLLEESVTKRHPRPDDQEVNSRGCRADASTPDAVRAEDGIVLLPKKRAAPTIVPSLSRSRTPEVQDDDDDDELSENDDEEGQMIGWSKGSPKQSLSLPQIQLLNLTYTALTATSVKLKWNLQSTGTDQHPVLLLLQEKASGGLFAHHFVAEMLINSPNKGVASPNKEWTETNVLSRTVYQGNSTTCRVLHLQCAQQYSFRVRTVIDHHSLVSNLLTITTPEQALNAKPKHKGKQPHNHQHTHEQDQQSKTPEKHTENHVSAPEVSDQSECKDDQKRAVLILLSFTGFALLVAVLIQHLLSP